MFPGSRTWKDQIRGGQHLLECEELAVIKDEIL